MSEKLPISDGQWTPTHIHLFPYFKAIGQEKIMKDNTCIISCKCMVTIEIIYAEGATGTIITYGSHLDL